MASVQEWLSTANAVVPRLAPQELKDLLSRPDVVLIDVRDAPEVQQSGKLRGARNISRGMLEFRADAASAYHDPVLQKRPHARPVLRVGRTLRTRRQDAAGHGLHLGLQRGRIQ